MIQSSSVIDTIENENENVATDLVLFDETVFNFVVVDKLKYMLVCWL